MSFYCHSIFIGQINEYPMKITHKNSMKNNFMEYSLVKFQRIFIRLVCDENLGHPNFDFSECFRYFQRVFKIVFIRFS